jgi:hypothetical protein
MAETIWNIFAVIFFFMLTGPLWLYAAVVAGFPFVLIIGLGLVALDWLGYVPDQKKAAALHRDRTY